jgi:hypothetical protein
MAWMSHSIHMNCDPPEYVSLLWPMATDCFQGLLLFAKLLMELLILELLQAKPELTIVSAFFGDCAAWILIAPCSARRSLHDAWPLQFPGLYPSCARELHAPTFSVNLPEVALRWLRRHRMCKGSHAGEATCCVLCLRTESVRCDSTQQKYNLTTKAVIQLQWRISRETRVSRAEMRFSKHVPQQRLHYPSKWERKKQRYSAFACSLVSPTSRIEHGHKNVTRTQLFACGHPQVAKSPIRNSDLQGE